jgi:hypothetical protein
MWISTGADTYGMDTTRRADDDQAPAMRLLAAGVPLSLLIDLASSSGPDSETIAAVERASSW